MGKSLGALRRSFDGSEPFMTGGHQIKETAGATQHARRLRKIPVWALDDTQVQILLLRCFPSLKTVPEQRAKAARWARIIHLYYRMGYTAAKTADELGMTVKAITRALEHMTATLNRPVRPRGRPKNKGDIDATSGTTGEAISPITF